MEKEKVVEQYHIRNRNRVFIITLQNSYNLTSLTKSAIEKSRAMSPLALVKLTTLMELTSGIPEIIIGLIDGPVVIDHPDLITKNIREVPGKLAGICAQASSAACVHGTFVAGILCAKRNSVAPAICPNCTLLVRPIFAETMSGNGEMPRATPKELAEAIIDCIDAGVRVINLSAALAQPSSKGARIRRGSGLWSKAQCYCCCGGWESGNSWKFCHYPPPVGYSGCCV
ncbi:MAG: S8 family serine peptidase [Thermodesulfobacteriota bacterium]